MDPGMKPLDPHAWTKELGKLSWLVVVALAAGAVSFDIFIFVGVRVAPMAVGGFVCAVRPLGAIAAPLMRQQWLDYVVAQCTLVRSSRQSR